MNRRDMANSRGRTADGAGQLKSGVDVVERLARAGVIGQPSAETGFVGGRTLLGTQPRQPSGRLGYNRVWNVLRQLAALHSFGEEQDRLGHVFLDRADRDA